MISEYLEISFETYERDFLEALKVIDVRDYHAIFYKKSDKGIDFYFSWNNFKIKVFISNEEINSIYEGVDFTKTETRFSKCQDENPMIRKFVQDYLLNRAIPVMEGD